MKKYTLEEITEKINILNPNLEVVDTEYKNVESKIKLKCKIHGTNVESTFKSLKKGNTPCKECSIEKSRNNNVFKFSLEQYKNKVSSVNNTIEVVSDEYKNLHTKLNFKCTVCGNLWETEGNSILQGHGCPKCSIKIRANKQSHTLDFILNFIKNNNIQITLLSKEYKNSRTPLNVVCNVCDNQWVTNWNKIQSGYGCPECGKKLAHGKGEYSITSAELNKDIWINTDAILYLIKCHNDSENFFKIGITKNTIESRFCDKTRMPYKYSIVEKYNTNLYEACKKEQYILESKLLNKYTPNIKFSGISECFSVKCENELEEIIQLIRTV